MAVNHTEVVDSFLGIWSLISWVATSTDGAVHYPYGENPVGRIVYQPGGQMIACLMRRERTRFASENRLEATAAERESAYREYVSYFGTFKVQADAGTVTHHVEGASFPNWIGTDLVRSFDFGDATLVLSLTRPNGDVHALTWTR